MPIKPENRTRYPADWPAISLAAKERAKWRCQHVDANGNRCRCRQYAVGCWLGPDTHPPSPALRWVPAHGNAAHDLAGAGLHYPSLERFTYSQARQFAADADDSEWTGSPKLIVIVLTVAHLNHQPEDCRPENLAAMCQRHHLAYDHQHHQANAWATRRSRSGNLELFA